METKQQPHIKYWDILRDDSVKGPCFGPEPIITYKGPCFGSEEPVTKKKI